ncbi:VOC family protein [Halalkalibacterium ligniniphilum]|uniref:VOC family protein n=1 Tax=Halalkalibacterium ligniniphilum TaxID=1134413 RepID=UPI00034A1983|nr:VOC family protein [Halalkalibacterium ligniniphilum]
MIRYKALHHVSICVTDLEKAKHFYREVLGLTELERPPFDFEGAWFGVGDQQIHLIVYPNTRMLRENPMIDPKEAHFALRVESYEKTVAWLSEQGIEIIEKPNSTSGFAQIFCLDPDGNIIELNVEQTPKS